MSLGMGRRSLFPRSIHAMSANGEAPRRAMHADEDILGRATPGGSFDALRQLAMIGGEMLRHRQIMSKLWKIRRRPCDCCPMSGLRRQYVG